LEDLGKRISIKEKENLGKWEWKIIGGGVGLNKNIRKKEIKNSRGVDEAALKGGGGGPLKKGGIGDELNSKLQLPTWGRRHRIFTKNTKECIACPSNCGKRVSGFLTFCREKRRTKRLLPGKERKNCSELRGRTKKKMLGGKNEEHPVSFGKKKKKKTKKLVKPGAGRFINQILGGGTGPRKQRKKV